MSISDLYASGKHKQEIGHFANIVKIAKANGEISEAEEALLVKAGKKLNITLEEFALILKNPEKYPVNSPVSYDARIERLYNLTRLIVADHDVSNRQVEILERVVVGLGFSKETRKEVTVALSGDGADELFAGYNKHKAIHKVINESNSLLRLAKPFSKLVKPNNSSKLGNVSRKIEKFNELLAQHPDKRYEFLAAFNKDEVVNSLLNISDQKAPEFIQIHGLNDFLIQDQRFVLPNDMLKKVDLMSMRHSLEVRTPFLDHEVVNFANSLPVKYKIKAGDQKAVLKEAFRDMLPTHLFGIPKKGPIDDEMARTLKHAYLACVSYIDAQIGKMINALEKEGLRENTIIILWSDHGWHLGDMGIWGKATNYEIGTRVPLIIWTPDMKKEVRGTTSEALVELVDMYPTLSELAGLEKPTHLEGQSFVPLLSNPKQEWKSAVFSQFPNPALREWAANPLSKGMRETYFGPLIKEQEAKIKKQQGSKWNRELFENRLMGYGMRTNNYRMIVWKDYTKPESEPLFIELYDHKNDPTETKNVADENPEIVKELLVQFNKGWKGNLAKI